MKEEVKKKKTINEAEVLKDKMVKPKKAKTVKTPKKKSGKDKQEKVLQTKEAVEKPSIPVTGEERKEEKAVKKTLKHEKKPSTTIQYHGVGGRKTSTARVWISTGSGRFMINGRSLEQYVSNRPILLYQAVQPFMITNTSDKYDVNANVHGGGVVGQIGAVRNAIANALIEVNPDFRPPLRTTGMLTRDSRIKERKKYGRKRARKRFQFSKR